MSNLVHVKFCDEFQQQFSETCDTNSEIAFFDLVFDHLASPTINEFLGLYSQYHRGMRCCKIFYGSTIICTR